MYLFLEIGLWLRVEICFKRKLLQGFELLFNLYSYLFILVCRENREISASVPSNPLLVVDAHWVLTELPVGTHQHSAFREQQSKPSGLGHEALSQLHHEVFTKPQITTTLSTSNVSNDFSICLESFVEGNKLVNLDCGHRFHSSCLYPWLQTCGECPYCRSCIMLK